MSSIEEDKDTDTFSRAQAAKLLGISRKELTCLTKEGKLLFPQQFKKGGKLLPRRKFEKNEDIPVESLTEYFETPTNVTYCLACTIFEACKACTIKDAKKIPCHGCDWDGDPVYKKGKIFCTNPNGDAKEPGAEDWDEDEEGCYYTVEGLTPDEWLSNHYMRGDLYDEDCCSGCGCWLIDGGWCVPCTRILENGEGNELDMDLQVDKCSTEGRWYVDSHDGGRTVKASRDSLPTVANMGTRTANHSKALFQEEQANALFLVRAKQRWPELAKGLKKISELVKPTSVVEGEATPFDRLRDIHLIVDRLVFSYEDEDE